MADMTLNRFWTVRCSIPTASRHDSTRTYMAETCLGVTARTIDEAIATVRRERPGVVIWAVNHTGQIDHESTKNNQ